MFRCNWPVPAVSGWGSPLNVINVVFHVIAAALTHSIVVPFQRTLNTRFYILHGLWAGSDDGHCMWQLMTVVNVHRVACILVCLYVGWCWWVRRCQAVRQCAARSVFVVVVVVFTHLDLRSSWVRDLYLWWVTVMSLWCGCSVTSTTSSNSSSRARGHEFITTTDSVVVWHSRQTSHVGLVTSHVRTTLHYTQSITVHYTRLAAAHPSSVFVISCVSAYNFL